MQLARQKPEAIVMDISPKFAKELLETSPGNRRLRGWYVDLIAASMKRGEWRVTSQGIGINVLGQLNDAHHRLHGCIKSGVSFRSVVVFGTPVNAYEVIDIGMPRTYADRLLEDPRVANVLRLACGYVLNTSKPSIDQMRPIVEAGIGDAVRTLVEFCGATRKYYSSAPMKLAACITIMNGGNADYVLQQYRALCLLDFESMSKSAQALVRQVDSGKIKAITTRETIARGFRVFDKGRSGVSKIQIRADDTDAATDIVRSVLRNSINEDRRNLTGKVGAGWTARYKARA